MSMLDAILAGIRAVLSDGEAVPSRSTINFIGVTVEDDAENDRTNVTVAGGQSWTFVAFDTREATDAETHNAVVGEFIQADTFDFISFVVLPDGAEDFDQVAVRVLHHGPAPADVTVRNTADETIFEFGLDWDGPSDMIGCVTFMYTAATGWFRFAEAKGPAPLDDGGGEG